jgi:hypothetical protein
MTKKELFEILANCPDDAEIYIEIEDVFHDDNTWGPAVREPAPMVRMVQDFRIAQRPCQETSGAKKSVVL